MRSWFIAALVLPVTCLASWGSSVLAKDFPSVRVIASDSVVSANHRVMVNCSVAGLSGARDYAYWIKTPAGKWQRIQSMSAQAQDSFIPNQAGTYWIQARVISHGAYVKRDWKQEVNSPLYALYVGPPPTLSTSNADGPVQGELTLTGTAASVSQPLYQLWIRSGVQGAWQKWGSPTSTAKWSVVPTTSGPLEARFSVQTPGGLAIDSNTVTYTAFGLPTALSIAGPTTPLVADGEDTREITVSVRDSQGDLVANFNGNGTLIDTQAVSIGKWGSSPESLNQPNGALPLEFKNGVATIWIQAGTEVATDQLSAEVSDGDNRIQGDTSVASVAPVATAIRVTSKDTFLIGNESGIPVTDMVSVVDQVGNNMLTGTYNLTANISGPGQFPNMSAGPQPLSYDALQGPLAVTVWSIAGGLGPVDLTVSGNNLQTGSLTMPAILGGQPYRMGVSAATTQITNGESTLLTLTQLTKEGGVCSPGSLDNGGYVVSITASNGEPASGFTLDGAPYQGSLNFPVAYGQDGFYAVSQTVSLGVTTASPGLYTVTVADGDGVFKPSQPLIIQVVSSS